MVTGHASLDIDISREGGWGDERERVFASKEGSIMKREKIDRQKWICKHAVVSADSGSRRSAQGHNTS
ncbi:hypothetical protein VNO78_28934 [Psophocarpus tetragonolobus]|uniref:Uncharacterized protein n=1 Tax=Psophocarpus tetragonolobus TaxID=3891 RepID=A0AAN9RU16_PSOTE